MKSNNSGNNDTSCDKDAFPAALENILKKRCRDDLMELKKKSAYLVGHDMAGYDAMFTDERRHDAQYLSAHKRYLGLNVRELMLEGYRHFFVVYREGTNCWFAECVAEAKGDPANEDVTLWLFVPAGTEDSESFRAVKECADEVVDSEQSNFDEVEKEVLKYVNYVFSMYHNPDTESIAALAEQAGVRHTKADPRYLLASLLAKDGKNGDDAE